MREVTRKTSFLAGLALFGLTACVACSPTASTLVTVEDFPAPPVLAMHFQPNIASLPTLATKAEQMPVIREVYWTATEPKTPQQLALAWGVKLTTLTELNPGLEPDKPLDEGTALMVFSYDAEAPPQSIGSPNRGKLRNGMPLPEGEAWRLRPFRRRAFGTYTTVDSLVAAFEAYGGQFPDGPKIRVGELAKRTGGRVSPHVSHRSGRDVDIGYIFRGDDNGEDRWRYMHEQNFDAEKNWFLVHELLKSGQVQTIYMSKRLQKILHREAAKVLSEDELAQTFEYPRTAQSPHATIQHWRGHHDHMHVRFKCEPGNRRCRPRGH